MMNSFAVATGRLRPGLLVAALATLLVACGGQATSVECEVDADCGSEGLQCIVGFCVDVSAVGDATVPGDIGVDTDDPGVDHREDPTEVTPDFDDPDLPDELCLQARPDVLVLRAPAPGVGALGSVQVRNCGDVPVEDVTWSLDGDSRFSVVEPVGATTLEPGATVVVRMRFSSAEPVDAAAELLARVGTERLPLARLRGVLEAQEGACMVAEPGVVELNEIIVGEQTVGGTLLRNCGTVPLVFTEIDERPEGAEILFGEEFPDSLSPNEILDPGEVRRLELGLTASAPGTYLGWLGLEFTEVTMDFVPEVVALRILLSATVLGEAETCLVWEPAVLRLASWASGEQSSSGAAVLRNCGSADLELTEVLAEDGFAVGGESLPFTLAAGASVDWTVRGADGLAPGAYLGRVRARAGDVAEAALAVQAEVLDAQDQPCLSISPGPVVSFGVVRLGTSTIRALEVVNCGTLPTQVRLDAVAGDISELSLQGSLALPLEPGERRQISARALAETLGPLRAEWLVRDDRGTSLSVVLTAQAVEVEPPCLEATLETPAPVLIPFGGEAVVRVRLENCDERTLLLSDFAWAEPSPYIDGLAAPRSVSETSPSSEVLASGASATLQGRLPGTSAGEFDLLLSLLVEAEDEVEESRIVRIPVQIEPPGAVCVGVEPPFVDFGILPEGETANRQVEVFNCGEASVVLDGLESTLPPEGVFQVTQGPGWGSAVSPGGVRVFTVQARDVADAARGVYEGEVRVEGTSIDGRALEIPVDLSVELGAEPACLEVVPERVDDGPITVGETRSWPVTVTNCGATTTRVDRATFLQGGAGFSVSLPPATLRTLAPGASLQVNVSLTPAAAGRASDVLQVESAAASDGRTAVAETEFEIDVVAPAPCLTLEPTSLAFGQVEIGQSATRTLTATNCGTSPLRMSAIRIVAGAPRFVVTTVPTTERVLLAGERRTLTVRFEPANEGVRNGVLEVVAEPLAQGPATPVTASLVGEGVQIPPCLEWSQDLLDLGTMRPGERQERTVSVRNCGEGPIDVLSLSLRQPGTDWTAVLSASSQPLAPGALRSVTIAFESTTIGLSEALVSIMGTSDPAAAFATLQLRARVSDEVCAQILPTTLAFGTVAPASTTERTFQVVNCGTSPARIERVDLAPSVTGLRLEASLEGQVLQPGQSVAGRLVLEAGTQARVVNSTLRAELRSVSDPSADGEVATAAITANVQAQQLCLAWEPTRVDFGEVPASTLRTRMATLRNCGNVAVSLTTFSNALTVFSLRNRAAVEGVTLPPQAGIDVELGFLASTPNTYQDQLVVEASGPGGTSVSRALDLEATVAREQVCFDLFPTALDFGEVAPGQVRERTVVVTNCGGDTLELRPGAFDTFDGVFSLQLDQLPVVILLGPGESASYVFRMQSSEPGAYATTYRTSFGSGTEDAEVALPMSGVVLPTQTCVTLSPALLDFGEAAIGGTASRTVTVANCGDAPLRVESLSVVIGGPGFSVQSLTDANRTIPAGSSRSYVVTFAPDQSGVSEGRLDMEARAVGAPDAVTRTTLLRGEVPAAPPCLSLSTGQLDWGTVTGQQPVQQTLRLTNCGTTNLTILPPQLTAGSPAFSLQTLSAEQRVLEPGADVGLTVTFAAGLDSGTYTGNVRIEARGAQPTPLEVRNVSLRAQVASVNRCLEAVTAAVDFGSIEVGSNSTESVTLRNCGDVPVTVDAFVLPEDSAFAVEGFSSNNATLAPGASRSWTVRFQPPSAGTFTDDLLADAQGVGSVRIALSGQGLTPLPDRCLEVTPTALDFGTVSLNSSVNRSFVLTNCGRQSVSVAGMTFRGQSGFALTNPALANGFTVAAGASRQVTVRFSSVVPGTYTGALQIATPESGGSDERSVSLTATAAVFPSCPTLNARASRESDGPFGNPVYIRRGQTVVLDPGLGRALAPSEQFSWQFVELPQGVSAPSIVPQGNQGRATVTLPATGRYRLRARLVTLPGMGGCDEQSTVTVRVTEATGNADGLRFVMTWSTPGDPDESRPPGSDVDMHLVRVVNNRAVWNSGQDIYFGNRTSDWGVPGDPSDDPELLRDETQGRGPEIIVHPNPNRQEVYLLGAYYWSDRNFGPSNVTFRVFRDGIEILSFSRVLENTGRFWLAARLDLEGEIITLLPEPNRDGFPPDTVVPQVP